MIKIPYEFVWANSYGILFLKSIKRCNLLLGRYCELGGLNIKNGALVFIKLVWLDLERSLYGYPIACFELIFSFEHTYHSAVLNIINATSHNVSANDSRVFWKTRIISNYALEF